MRTTLTLLSLLSMATRASAHDEDGVNSDPYIWGSILVVLTFVIIMGYYVFVPLRQRLNEINSQYHSDILESDKFT